MDEPVAGLDITGHSPYGECQNTYTTMQYNKNVVTRSKSLAANPSCLDAPFRGLLTVKNFWYPCKDTPKAGEEIMKKQNDITGQRFGKLVAKKFVYYDEKYRDNWLFRCDCGTEKIMPTANVKWGRVRSCGCLRRIHIAKAITKDLADQRFGRLTAIRPTEKRDASGSIIWECQCDCGNTIYYSTNTLNVGKTQSCGCLQKEKRKESISYRRDFVEDTSVSRLIVAKKPRSDNTSGCPGVSYDKKNGRWTARIAFQKKQYYLGSYINRIDAINARKSAEKCLHDPLVMENMDRLTETSKKAFLEYLSGKSDKP